MIKPTLAMFKNMDGQSSVYITADKEVPVNAEDGNNVSICIDQVIASVLGKSENVQEACQHIGYVLHELQKFSENINGINRELEKFEDFRSELRG